MGGDSEDGSYELNALFALTDSLLGTHAFDEAEKILPRFRELAMARSASWGRPLLEEFHCLGFSARLHEVLCICPPELGTPSPCLTLELHLGL